MAVAGQDCIMWSFINVTLYLTLTWSNQEIWHRRACSTHGRDEKCIQHFGYKTWREKNLEDLVADRSIILEWILQK